MKYKQSFSSVIGSNIASYLALKVSLGMLYTVEGRILKNLDTFLAAVKADLTAESFSKWCKTVEHLTNGVRRNWMRVVRNYCLYRRRTNPACFVPDPSQFPLPHQPVQPYIFTEADIVKLLAAANRLKPGSRSPLHRGNVQLALVLLYTTGLRRGELLRLTVGDYDSNEHTLLVRESKFHKSRLLPLSCDGAREIDLHIASRRKRRLPASRDAPLLWNPYTDRGAYTGVGVSGTIRNLFKATGIRTVAGRLPRVHDIRHTFAVHALMRWYRAGQDVQAKLPYLAIYMGHVNIVSTQYYLQFNPQIAASASDRFAQRCGGLLTLSGISGGN